MPCYSPLHGYKSKTASPEGKREVKFSRTSGYADLEVTVPCGKCIGCRIDRSRAWALRCSHEAKMHSCNSFLTLTYDDEHLPADKSISVRELQLFLKRLRNSIGEFRYFAVGEYGDITKRPHYHMLLFGHDFAADRKVHSRNKRGDVIYKSDQLNEIWGLGYCLIGSLNYASAAYTARYTMKKVGGDKAAAHYSRVDAITGELFHVQPEFCLMSRRPGIGSSWYEKFKKDAFPSDFLVVQGKKHPVPRYYLDKLGKEDSKTLKKVKLKRLKGKSENKEELSLRRLRVREEVKASKLLSLKRTL